MCLSKLWDCTHWLRKGSAGALGLEWTYPCAGRVMVWGVQTLITCTLSLRLSVWWMVMAAEGVMHWKLKDGTEPCKCNDHKWSCQPRQWHQNSKVKRALKSGRVREGILEGGGVCPGPEAWFIWSRTTWLKLALNAKQLFHVMRMHQKSRLKASWCQNSSSASPQLLSVVSSWALDCSTMT